jgi:exopolysaccharide biosynthesis protein
MAFLFNFRIKIEMKKKVILISLLLLNLTVVAQNVNKDSLLVVNSKWNVKKHKGNIKTKTIHFKDCDLFDSNQAISIIEVSPKCKYKFDLAYQTKNLVTLDSFVNIQKAIAGINGTFFDVKNGGSMDFLRSNYQIVNINFNYPSGKRAEHQKGAVLINNDKLSLSMWDGKPNWEFDLIAEDVMLSGPVLRINHQDIGLANNSFNADRAPRSLIGIKSDGTVLLICIDGRTISSEGMTIKENQNLARWLGCKDAINLDGGGSSTLYLKNATENGIINHPSDNKIFDHYGQRKIANAILLVK